MVAKLPVQNLRHISKRQCLYLNVFEAAISFEVGKLKIINFKNNFKKTQTYLLISNLAKG
jgi:hypothetical protein